MESEDSSHDEIVNSGIKSFISHRASKNLSGKISNFFEYSDDPFITPPKQVVNKNVKKEAVLLKEVKKKVKKEVLISKEKYISEQQNKKTFKSLYKNPLMTSSRISVNVDEEKILKENRKLKKLLTQEGIEKGILEGEKNFLAKETKNLKELLLEKCQENDNLKEENEHLKEEKKVSDNEAIIYMRLSKVLLDNNKTLNDCLKTQQHMNTLLEKNAMEKGEIENVLQQLSVFNNNKKKANKYVFFVFLKKNSFFFNWNFV